MDKRPVQMSMSRVRRVPVADTASSQHDLGRRDGFDDGDEDSNVRPYSLDDGERSDADRDVDDKADELRARRDSNAPPRSDRTLVAGNWESQTLHRQRVTPALTETSSGFGGGRTALVCADSVAYESTKLPPLSAWATSSGLVAPTSSTSAATTPSTKRREAPAVLTISSDDEPEPAKPARAAVKRSNNVRPAHRNTGGSRAAADDDDESSGSFVAASPAQMSGGAGGMARRSVHRDAISYLEKLPSMVCGAMLLRQCVRLIDR
jgi:hypothetical protein